MKAQGKGTGVAQVPNEQVIFVGTWNRGEMYGQGQASSSNWKYKGSWMSGRFHGEGMLNYSAVDTSYYYGEHLQLQQQNCKCIIDIVFIFFSCR